MAPTVMKSMIGVRMSTPMHIMRMSMPTISRNARSAVSSPATTCFGPWVADSVSCHVSRSQRPMSSPGDSPPCAVLFDRNIDLTSRSRAANAMRHLARAKMAAAHTDVRQIVRCSKERWTRAGVSGDDKRVEMAWSTIAPRVEDAMMVSAPLPSEIAVAGTTSPASTVLSSVNTRRQVGNALPARAGSEPGCTMWRARESSSACSFT
mmetsp:Transcript_22963/g.71856  ORF Transcript_22963/g.71856 Transcript_22963/m.71856 type:complete len:207 (-) Transcript_22963:97-717(-)